MNTYISWSDDISLLKQEIINQSKVTVALKVCGDDEIYFNTFESAWYSDCDGGYTFVKMFGIPGRLASFDEIEQFSIIVDPLTM